MNDEDELLIYHIFADRGVESEFLSGYGRVVRVGLDPFENEYSEVVRADAREIPLAPGADLVLLHPPCYLWAESTRHIPDEVREEDYEDLIPTAREIGRELGEHYIIENVPKAPLKDPVVLNGRHFRLPIHYERAFETSFPVKQPTAETKREDEVSWWDEYSRPLNWWKAAKGYRTNWEKDSLVKVASPTQYLNYIMGFYLAERYDLDAPVDEQVALSSY